MRGSYQPFSSWKSATNMWSVNTVPKVRSLSFGFGFIVVVRVILIGSLMTLPLYRWWPGTPHDPRVAFPRALGGLAAWRGPYARASTAYKPPLALPPARREPRASPLRRPAAHGTPRWRR